MKKILCTWGQILAFVTLPLGAQSGPVRFGAIGDTPYTAQAETQILGVFARATAESMPFLLHVGDIWSGGNSDCSVADYQSRRAIFDASAVPLVVVPGDNEWTDCAIDHNVALQRFRDHLLEDAEGALVPILIGGVAVERQAARIENVRWLHDNVQFLGLSLPGGARAGMSAADLSTLMNDNIQFLLSTFAQPGVDPAAAVIFLQALPRCSFGPDDCTFFNTLRDEVVEFGKPVLLIHGDNHGFDFDQPFTHDSGAVISNWWRLQLIFESTDWTEAEFDPSDPAQPFRIRNHIAARLAADEHKLSTAVPAVGDGFGSALLTAHFNGDGFVDLVAGMPGHGSDAGAVVVALAADEHYGLVDGDLLVQGQGADLLEAPIAGGAEVGDLFGVALASGDFNGDGLADLVIGAPGEAPGVAAAGGVFHVLPGKVDPSAPQERFAPDVMIHQGLSWVGGDIEAGDLFGRTLVACDITGDGFDDLVVGVPGEAPGSLPQGGAIHAFAGSPNGLANTANLLVHQGAFGLAGVVESGDRFGEALAAGDFNGDGFCDVAIGAPGEAIGTAAGGAVNLLMGAPGGFTGAPLLYQGTAQLAGVVEAGDEFGFALAAADLNADGFDDLLIGVPGEAPGNLPAGGAFQVVWGSSGSSFPASDGILFYQGILGIAGIVEADDRFGEAFAVGDLDGDGLEDLIVAAPGEALGSRPGSGAVEIFWGNGSGTDLHWEGQGTMPGCLDAGDPGCADSVTGTDRFGAVLAVGDTNGDGHDDLILALPGKENGEGAIIIQNGTSF